MLEVRPVESGAGISQPNHKHMQRLPGKADEGSFEIQEKSEREGEQVQDRRKGKKESKIKAREAALVFISSFHSPQKSGKILMRFLFFKIISFVLFFSRT